MAKPLLRSGKLEDFLAMGENGQPVYTSALQLRETLRLRQHQNIAQCMAVPQPNEGGDRVDWYSPIDGEQVIPWSAASEQERASALAQLETRHAALIDVSQHMQGSEKTEQQLFGALLAKAMQFPGKDHVYLVDGKPVLTFWGFVNADHASRPDPLDCLRPAIPVAAIPPVTPSASTLAAAPLHEPLPVREKRVYRWWHWRRFGWLLPLLLLLLAFLLLRGCVPGVNLPGFPGAAVTLPDVSLPTGHVALPRGDAALNLTTPHGVSTTTQPVDGTPVSAEGQGVAIAEDHSAAGSEPLAPADTHGSTPPSADPAADPAIDPATGTVPDDANGPLPPLDPALAPNGAPLQPTADNAAGAATPLTIPGDALKNGSTGFLNGNWKAGSGIQDQRTGKPLSLQYQINDGKGSVQMTRGDGVTCRAGVDALINNGALAINNQGQAQCSDGSSYKMPEIVCQPNAQSAADCKGRYDANTVFPMTMKRGSE